MNGYESHFSNSINGLKNINCDEIIATSLTTDTFLNTPSAYYTGVTSNLQNQINNLAISGGVMGYQGATGLAGAQGVAGAQGATGARGAQGAQGAQGATPILTIGPVTSLPAGTAPTVEIVSTLPNTRQLNFGLVQGAQGATGATGLQGATGQGYTFYTSYSTAQQYNPYDCVLYNGTTYVCILTSLDNYPDNTTYWSILAQKGEQGERGYNGGKGDDGDKGAKGSKGDDGPKGDRGSDGDSTVATAAAIAAAASSTAAVVAVAGVAASVVALQVEVAAIQGQIGIIDGEIISLQTKTALQACNGSSTSFTGNVNINNGVSNKVVLGSNGDIFCDDKLTSNSIETNAITATNISANSLGLVGNISCANINNTGNLNAGSVFSSTHTINGTSFVVNALDIQLNGIVSMPLSFFSQW